MSQNILNSALRIVFDKSISMARGLYMFQCRVKEGISNDLQVSTLCWLPGSKASFLSLGKKSLAD